jgi:hypothetical protein
LFHRNFNVPALALGAALSLCAAESKSQPRAAAGPSEPKVATTQKSRAANHQRAEEREHPGRPVAGALQPLAGEEQAGAGVESRSATEPGADAADPLEPAERQARPSIWPYVIGGAGVASLGASLALATWGRQDDELLARCAPNCRRESVDHVKNLYFAADISLGVGVLALGAATYLYVASQPGSDDPTRDRSAVAVDVKPIRSGGFATLEGSF